MAYIRCGQYIDEVQKFANPAVQACTAPSQASKLCDPVILLLIGNFVKVVQASLLRTKVQLIIRVGEIMETKEIQNNPKPQKHLTPNPFFFSGFDLLRIADQNQQAHFVLWIKSDWLNPAALSVATDSTYNTFYSEVVPLRKSMSYQSLVLDLHTISYYIHNAAREDCDLTLRLVMKFAKI
ncbi:hypothetical protein TURU_018849 [Turdus rufiventris]|nr:hypothetical protein TURU_018849 [Turdus rufiventris]